LKQKLVRNMPAKDHKKVQATAGYRGRSALPFKVQREGDVVRRRSVGPGRRTTQGTTFTAEGGGWSLTRHSLFSPGRRMERKRETAD